MVHGEPAALDEARLHGALILKLERTLDQDVAYGLRLLVDIAERSLADSPFQDPTTAVQAIDRLHDLLRHLARRPFPDGRLRDGSGHVRLVTKQPSWEDYVHLAFDEIRMAGAGSPPVARRLAAALRDLRSIALPERLAVLDDQLDLLMAATTTAMDDSRDVELGDPGPGRDRRGHRLEGLRRRWSVPDEAAEELGTARRASGARFLAVGGVHHPQPGVGADPAQRLRLPPGRAVVHPGQPRQVGVAAEHQVGERLAGEVRGADAVTDVPAAPAEPGARVEADRGVPVARDAERVRPTGA